MTHRYFLSVLFLLFIAPLAAQTCEYQVVLEDLVRGDGWNGGQLIVRVGSQPFTFTLGNGSSQTFYVPVTDGDAIALDFREGAFPEEISFQLLNNNDEVLFAAADPTGGTDIFTTTAACVACAAPPLSGIVVERVRSTTVDISFRGNPASDDPEYLIQYAIGSFDPTVSGVATELVIDNRVRRITNLEPGFSYSLYLSTLCNDRADTSDLRGPFNFTTRPAVDLGITEIRSPQTGCGNAAQNVTIGITNYGGEPQSFFEIGYSINGREATIDYPFDGVFTGVVGVDSTEFFTFDNPASLNDPGRYQFKVRTMIEGDADAENDELTLSIVRQPTIEDFPYTEDFEDNDGFWVPGRSGRGPISWAWGQPRGTVIGEAPQGSNAWVTNLFGDYFNGEESYLISPCFDFTEMEEDPYFSCALIVDTEEDFDGLSLEMSTDDGETWSTVSISPADLNWYNDRPNQVWEGDGGFGNGPRIVANLLEGAAGEVVKLRFVFTSSLDDTREGVLVDAVTIGERGATDVAVVAVDGEIFCAEFERSAFTVTYQNVGTAVVDSVFINIPAGDGLTDTIVERLAPGNFRTYEMFVGNSMLVGPSPSITVTVTTPDDVNPANDQGIISRPALLPLPFFEGFENGVLPRSWSVIGAGDITIAPNPNTGSNSLIIPIPESDGFASLSTAIYEAPILPTDSLRFTVDVLELPEGGKVSLEVFSTECDVLDTLFRTDSLESLTYAISLANVPATDYFFNLLAEGGAARISFDDINITRCPGNLSVDVDVIPTTTRNAANARATLTPSAGIAPYTYAWSTGATTQTVTDLAFGEYTVTVTDRLGCTDEVQVVVRNFLDTEDPQGLLRSLAAYPNPTSGELRIDLDLANRETVTAEVYDATGRRVALRSFGNTNQVRESLDLNGFAPGIYLVRVQAGGAARSVRVIRK
ncbi:T9SS type A sorting domain-containing protein [Lewinella sp. 4G2]|uniref:T9SS type A sorting domain-containing protein n=1 Tax=Lewinella sp. 4G2 TaxID=1803372 RepID=UPI0007B4E729|nr:T9SS type A sorting domain-containing protein [Lewinella sp. 4G2]OAV43327.1 hypothetical protein A3850_001920 [Lewinella sp. 4G2]